jgi:tetratricopeptide (TPR) repeat protein
VTELRLEAVDFVDLTRWRWVLTDDDSGAFLADHEVRLDASSWQFEAFADLAGYLEWRVPPDRQAQNEARMVSSVGEWIGSTVLGPVAAALVRARPATVRVTVPEGAAELLARPLELAHVGGKPLAVQDVTLVMETGPGKRRVSPVGERLRVLGLFSLPEGGPELNLRRERYSLVQLIKEIAATGRAADVRVLQYGVTRERLEDALEEAEGWDIIHISGHARPGELLMETAAGRPDRVTAIDLADMLDLARERVKLVTVAACWSAARTVADQRRLLGLPVPYRPAGDSPDGNPGRGRANADHRAKSDYSPAARALATELAARLGCAVLAMRYPVTDDFAIALSGRLYDLLVRQGQPLPRAVGMTLRQLVTETEGPRFPALTAATPALFGGTAVDLRLAAPGRPPGGHYGTGLLKMAGFPAQGEHFVGRTGLMARARATLAARSGIPGVLLVGMPGGGKTACALELCYEHEGAFDRLVWFTAPDEGTGLTEALTDFALTLERYLPGFQMAHAVLDDGRLVAFLPWLTELVEQRRLLIVIDNAESLLTDGGQWRDARWGKVIDALTAHAGQGRLILTSRNLPAGATKLRVEPVGALSADETLLLDMELLTGETAMSGEDYLNARAAWTKVAGGKGEATDTGLLVRAGLAEVPYLMRQGQWAAAAAMIERAFNRDPSRANANAMLPVIEQIRGHEERAARLAAQVLMAINPAVAEQQMRAYTAAAATRGDYSEASIAAMWIVELCRRSGRLIEALALTSEMTGYTRQAGHGPWTQLLDEAIRLQVLGEMGHAKQVLAEVQRLRVHMDSLPATPGEGEITTAWNVREMLLDAARNAARQLEQWPDALDLNAEMLASKRARSAPAADIARAWYSDYSLLLELKRADEALALLRVCRQVFLDANDTGMLGMTFTALASTEDARGHRDVAIELEQDALRYKYRAGIMTSIAGSYHNLGTYLHGSAQQAALALASHLAAALIRALTGAEGTEYSVAAAALDLRAGGAAAAPPTGIADLCRQLGDIPGTDLPGLLQTLAPDPAAAEQALRELITQAQALAASAVDLA